MKKYAWLLCGPTGSGKSTVRKAICDETPDTVVSSSDDYLIALCEGLSITYQDAYMKFADEAEEMAQQKIRQAIERGNDLIIDRTNLSVNRRAAYIAGLKDSYDIVAVIPDFDVKSPDGIALLEERRLSRSDREIMPASSLVSHLNAWQEPTLEEGFVVILTQSDVLNALRRVQIEGP